MATPEERRQAAMRGAHKRDAARNWDLTEWQIGEAYDALLKHFEDTDQKPVADAMRFGYKPHDYEPTTIDCGGNCVIDVCKRCGQAADSDNWTEFCVIDYPEPDEQPPKVGQ